MKTSRNSMFSSARQDTSWPLVFPYRYWFEVLKIWFQGRNKDTMVRNFVGLSPGFCALPASSRGSHSFGSNACLVVLKETWPSPQRVLIPVGFLAVVWGLVRT